MGKPREVLGREVGEEPREPETQKPETQKPRGELQGECHLCQMPRPDATRGMKVIGELARTAFWECEEQKPNCSRSRENREQVKP